MPFLVGLAGKGPSIRLLVHSLIRKTGARKNPLLTAVALGMIPLIIGTTGCGGGNAPQVTQTSLTDPTQPPPVQHFSIPTYHNDNSRSGINSLETTLTPANVNVVSFGKRAVVSVQGSVFAQPLYISNVTLSDSKAHNLVVVATEHDQVYGIDADTYQVMWQRSLWTRRGRSRPSLPAM